MEGVIPSLRGIWRAADMDLVPPIFALYARGPSGLKSLGRCPTLELLLVFNAIDSSLRAGVPFSVMVVACTSGRALSAGSTSRYKNVLSVSGQKCISSLRVRPDTPKTSAPLRATEHPSSGRETWTPKGSEFRLGRKKRQTLNEEEH